MKFVLFFFLTLSSVFVFAGRDDGFPLEPAPINQKIEGTWVSYDSGLEAPIIFQFCHISKRSIRLSQGASSEIAKNKIYNSMNRGIKTHEVSFMVRDIQVFRATYLKFNAHFLEGDNGEIVLRVRVIDRWGSTKKPIREFMMHKFSDRKPLWCR